MIEVERYLTNTLTGFNRLRRSIVPIKNEYDYILIECPSSLNIITSCALLDSDSCLTTLQPEIPSIRDLNKLLYKIDELRIDVNTNMSIEGTLFTLTNQRLPKTAI
ncbi:hypothetical protein E1171_03995 [Cytophagales bacterium RKSG123]|nr:hypothetical protein [Xanthovirga aplysinae]